MFAKVFQSMFVGSMMGAGSHVFAVWTWALANSSKDGFVEINPRLVAAVLGETVERVSEALSILRAPDPKSRSKDEDGRRLVQDGEYQHRIVNYLHYKEISDEQDRREYNRRKKRESRARQGMSRNVKRRHPSSAMSAHIDVEVEADGREDCTEPLPRSAPSIVFPVVGNGKTWEPDDTFIAKLRETFPNLDVPGELKKAALWAETHAAKRKTARGMPAFLARWMEREVNSFHPNVNGKPQPAQPPKPTPEQKAKRAAEQQRLLDDARLSVKEVCEP